MPPPSVGCIPGVAQRRSPHRDRSRRRLPALLLVLLYAGLQIACLPHHESAPQEATLTPVHLQLKWRHQFQFAGYYAAIDQGYYREAGLEVELLEAPDGREPAQVVLDGQAEFGVASSDLVLLRDRGAPVVALAAIFQHSPLILLAPREYGIESVHDLAGRQVMIEAHAAELLAYLEGEAVPASSMVLVPHSFNPEALIRGQVDAMSAYSTDEPFLLHQAGIEYLIFNPRAGGIDFYGDTLFTTEAYLHDHPAQVRAFLEASLRGWRYALEHQAELVELIYTNYSQRHSRAHLTYEAEQTRRLVLPDVVEIGYMNPGRWQRIAEIYAEQGFVRPGVSLKGFLYERNPPADMTWLYLGMSGIILVTGTISMVAARFYQLNRAFRSELAERIQIEQDLRALEERHRVLAEHAPFPIMISRFADGAILYINPESARSLAISQSHALSRITYTFFQDQATFHELSSRLERQGFLQSYEARMLTADGRPFWANLSASLINFEGQLAIFAAIMDVSQRKELELQLEALAMTDELTGLYNRRSFMQHLDEEFSRARRYHTPCALLMLDLDCFKQVNDSYGHAAGDRVLQHVAAILHTSLRSNGLAGRLGGEEFGILLPNSTLEQARQTAEHLCEQIAAEPIAIGSISISITVSIGVATYMVQLAGSEALLRNADQALYQAKAEGRNCVRGM